MQCVKQHGTVRQNKTTKRHEIMNTLGPAGNRLVGKVSNYTKCR